jgi:4-amino-4-deoxy-L-arabinose transferase-like glycosyltransferase
MAALDASRARLSSPRGLAAFSWLTASEKLGCGFLTLLTLVTRLPILTYPKACDDEQVYVVVAMEMVRGGRPYIDAIERKPPLLFYLYDAILRSFGAYNYFALHLASVVWTLATMAVLYSIVRRLFDPAAGFVAALTYAVFMAWANYTNLAFNGELLMNLPVVAAVAIAFRPTRSKLRAELFVAGALVAVAFLLKQPSVIAGVPLGIYVLLRDYRASRGLGWPGSFLHAALLALGFSFTLLAAGGLLVKAGILHEAWYWTITNHANPMGPTTWFFWHKLPLRGALFLVETLPLILAAALSLREGLNATGLWKGHRAEFTVLVVFLGVSALGVVANGQFNYHYFLQLTPPLVLLAAPVFSQIWQGTRSSRMPWFRPVFLVRWIGLTTILFLVVDTVGLALIRAPLKSAVYVREHSTENDKIFIWGQGTAQTGIYLDARRRPASRYIASFPLNGLIFGLLDPNYDTRDRIVPGAWDNLRADFARHPPKFIIDCHAMRDGLLHKIRDHEYLRRLLDNEYREVFRADDAIVYERQPTIELPSEQKVTRD